MGPALIFDKSALESLNIDEAVWLDNFFDSNITPLFYVETLADLEKNSRKDRAPESLVKTLADKTPDCHSIYNVHHHSLLMGELHGLIPIRMDGRPIIPTGKAFELDGETGIFYQQSPEEEAFQRWQKKEFLQIERLIAKKWRANLSNIDLEKIYKDFQKLLNIPKPSNLQQVKHFVQSKLQSMSQKNLLIFGLGIIGFPIELRDEIIKKWEDANSPPIKKQYPYFLHVLSIDFFFYIAIASDLIARGRPSHKIDVAYLYYLPFCKIFTSNDKLHKNIVPFFLQEDQTFLSGDELKKDLNEIDQYYEKLPPEIKETGTISFAYYPPTDKEFIVSSLWDKYMNPNWRTHKIFPSPQPENETTKALLKKFEKIKTEATPTKKKISSENADNLILQRNILGKKGKWKRFPPEVLNRKKNADGTWEDINKI